MATVASIQPAALRAEKGSPYPLGATPDAGGVNFPLFSENATGVELLLFERDDDLVPFQTFQFDPFVNKTFHFWHIRVRGLTAGAHYAHRVDGPFDLSAGHCLNRNKVLIDPFARGNTDTLWTSSIPVTKRKPMEILRDCGVAALWY